MLGIPFVYKPIIFGSNWTTHFRVPLHPTYTPSNARAVTVYRKCYITFLIFKV